LSGVQPDFVTMVVLIQCGRADTVRFMLAAVSVHSGMEDNLLHFREVRWPYHEARFTQSRAMPASSGSLD
jgi:hypothetical protein